MYQNHVDESYAVELVVGRHPEFPGRVPEVNLRNREKEKWGDKIRWDFSCKYQSSINFFLPYYNCQNLPLTAAVTRYHFRNDLLQWAIKKKPEVKIARLLFLLWMQKLNLDCKAKKMFSINTSSSATNHIDLMHQASNRCATSIIYKVVFIITLWMYIITSQDAWRNRRWG